MASETKLQPLKPERDEDLVQTLKRWLEQAESGKITGALLLGNMRGEDVAHCWVGEFPIGRILVAFEWWKLSVFTKENLERP